MRLTCKTSNKLNTILGEYNYYVYDSGGSKIAEGTLSITSLENNQLKGQWNLKAVGNTKTKNIELLLGKSQFEGMLKGGKISITSNPGMNDNNVFLNGEFHENELKGTWNCSTFAGPISKGKFEAKRK